MRFVDRAERRVVLGDQGVGGAGRGLADHRDDIVDDAGVGAEDQARLHRAAGGHLAYLAQVAYPAEGLGGGGAQVGGEGVAVDDLVGHPADLGDGAGGRLLRVSVGGDVGLEVGGEGRALAAAGVGGRHGARLDHRQAHGGGQALLLQRQQDLLDRAGGLRLEVRVTEVGLVLVQGVDPRGGQADGGQQRQQHQEGQPVAHAPAAQREQAGPIGGLGRSRVGGLRRTAALRPTRPTRARPRLGRLAARGHGTCLHLPSPSS